MIRLGYRRRTLEACVLLAVATLLRRYVTMRRWSRVLGEMGPVRPAPAPVGPSDPTERAVALAVAAAARRLPAATTCLDRAIAASLMMRARGRRPRLLIGMPLDDPRGTSHAWLVGESGRVVVGDGELERFRPVTQFG